MRKFMLVFVAVFALLMAYGETTRSETTNARASSFGVKIGVPELLGSISADTTGTDGAVSVIDSTNAATVKRPDGASRIVFTQRIVPTSAGSTQDSASAVVQVQHLGDWVDVVWFTPVDGGAAADATADSMVAMVAWADTSLAYGATHPITPGALKAVGRVVRNDIANAGLVSPALGELPLLDRETTFRVRFYVHKAEEVTAPMAYTTQVWMTVY